MGNMLMIFDFDNILIQGDSSMVWSQFMVCEGLVMQKGYFVCEVWLMVDYDWGEMNIVDYVVLIQVLLVGILKLDVDVLVVCCVCEVILFWVYLQVWEFICCLWVEGEQMLIIFVMVSLLVQVVVVVLEIDQVLGIDVVMVDGGYSGEIIGIFSYQQGKVVCLVQWCEVYLQYDGEVMFYIDFINDLLLCLYVDCVWLVNFCLQLQVVGVGYGWLVLSWWLEQWSG